MAQIQRGKVNNQWSPALRSFALTLHFYSPRAYAYVRQSYDNKLPSESTIRKWYQTTEGSPGVTEESLNALKIKVQEAKTVGKKIVCSLIMDEMYIRKTIEWDKNKKKFVGYVDFGAGLDNKEHFVEAKEALTFLVNSCNDRWKVPVAYFFVNGLTSSEKMNILNEVLKSLAEIDIRITSLTFNGAPSNLTMCKLMGANFDVEDMKPYILHPTKNEKIYILLDICHMVKLIRNTFAAKRVLYDENDEKIDWAYLERLDNFQKEKGFHLANKLRQSHIQWVRQKMKTSLAVQTFSNSVAAALEYLQAKKVPEFQGCNATIRFIRIINNIFDVFNSKNKFGYGYKKPIYDVTEKKYFDLFEEVESYFKNLSIVEIRLRRKKKNPELNFNRKIETKKSILTSINKTGFLGFLLAINSFKGIYDDLVKNEKLLDYVATYKFSQDHLEMFFSAIRSRGGFNNNPSASQFASAYKRLLIHSEIKPSKYANAVPLESFNILTVSSSESLKIINNSSLPADSTEFVKENEAINEYKDEVQINDISSSIGDDTTTYIAGYVERKVREKIKCKECIQALDERDIDYNDLDFVNCKDKGGLFSPRKDVATICKIAERNLSIFQLENKLNQKNFYEHLINSCFRMINSSVFDNMDEHIFESKIFENHRYYLIKFILEQYLNTKLFYIGFNKTMNISSTAVRQLYNKLILFAGQ